MIELQHRKVYGSTSSNLDNLNIPQCKVSKYDALLQKTWLLLYHLLRVPITCKNVGNVKQFDVCFTLHEAIDPHHAAAVVVIMVKQKENLVYN